MSVHKLSANGSTFAYRWDGNPDGPIVMMAHAMGTSHRIWDLQVPALAEKFRLLRYDWRGHGDSDAPPGPYSLPQFEADAVAVMDVLGLDKVHWVGISTGGMIGQGLGINYPERLHSIALCNTTPQSNPWYRGWVAERQAVVREGGMAPVWEMTKALWFNEAFIEQANEDYTVTQQVFEATPIEGYLGGTSAVADLDYLDRLVQIDKPTLVIAAGDDPVTPIDHSEKIHERIKGSRLEIIAGQRHFSNIEVPQLFNPILRAHLDRQT